MKRLLTTIFIGLLSGCTLTQGNHFAAESPVSARKHSACGYFSNAIPVGARNQSTIQNKDFHIEFCGTKYRTRQVAAGFIIPFIPLFGKYHNWDNLGQVRVTNLNTDAPLIIDSKFSDDPKVIKNAQFFRDRYPIKGRKLSTYPESAISLNTGESVWIGLPISENPSITFHSGKKRTTVDFKSTTAFGWAMLTR